MLLYLKLAIHNCRSVRTDNNKEVIIKKITGDYWKKFLQSEVFISKQKIKSHQSEKIFFTEVFVRKN